jgi:hypothetical protein
VPHHRADIAEIAAEDADAQIAPALRQRRRGRGGQRRLASADVVEIR